MDSIRVRNGGFSKVFISLRYGFFARFFCSLAVGKSKIRNKLFMVTFSGLKAYLSKQAAYLGKALW